MSWLSSLFGAKKEEPKAACHDGVCAMPEKKGGVVAGGNGGKVNCGESCDCCDEEPDTDRCCDDCEDCGAGEADE